MVRVLGVMRPRWDRDRVEVVATAGGLLASVVSRSERAATKARPTDRVRSECGERER